jgi:hypothetical protein
MEKSVNNYLKVLLYLKQHEGDGLLHDVEDILAIDQQQKQSILFELAKEDLIKLTGGGNDSSITIDSVTYGGGYIPAEARITFKGSKYLKEELEMIDNNRYNITVSHNSIANLILHSPGSTINSQQNQEKVSKIIETLRNDESIDNVTRGQAIATFTQLQTEITAGNPSQEIWNKALSIGANVASVGSLVLALVQQFVK